MPVAAPQPARELALASAIGNQAFARLVATRRAVAREPAAPAPPEAAASDAPAADGLVLQSADPALDGRDATEVYAELRDVLTSYRDGVETFTGSSLKMVEAEQHWAANLNLFGDLVELVNGADLPDPGRWDAVFALWDEVGAELDAALPQVAPATLNEAGAAGQIALELFDQAFELGQTTSDEFLAYMQGFQGAAITVHTVASVTRDIAFCALLAGVAVVAAPAAAGIGLTAGETALGMGLLGGTIGATVNTQAAALIEAMDLMHDLVVEGQSWEQALDGIDWALIGSARACSRGCCGPPSSAPERPAHRARSWAHWTPVPRPPPTAPPWSRSRPRCATASCSAAPRGRCSAAPAARSRRRWRPGSARRWTRFQACW